MIMVIADAELNMIRSLSSDMPDTVLKMTDFNNSNFRSKNNLYFLKTNAIIQEGGAFIVCACKLQIGLFVNSRI
jgi:hypothetical protein